MVDRQLLLADLLRLASEHKDYSGTVERLEGERFRLQFYPKPFAMIEECRLAWNEGVYALDEIAPRVMQFYGEHGIATPSAETPGASVMAWVLRDRFRPSHSIAYAISNAFNAIRESILRLDTHDIADAASQRLHRHDECEERVRQDELESSEAHRAQREKLKDACRRLKEAIKSYNGAHSQEGATESEARHLTRAVVETLSVIAELGLGPTMTSNAIRKDRLLLSGDLDTGQIGYVKDELRLHLLLIKCRNKTEEEITELLDAIGHLSPSSCDDLWIDLWHYEQFTDVVEEARLKEVAEQGGAEDSSVSPDDTADVPAAASPVPFTGGDLVFYADRVKLCGVDICSGIRSQSRRIMLELLARKDDRGQFAYYAGDDLENEIRARGGKGKSVGLIRDLRSDIAERLRSQANIACDPKKIILSRDTGYRFSQNLSVQWADPPNFVKSNYVTETKEDKSSDNVGGEMTSGGDHVGGEAASDGDDGGNSVGDDVGDCVTDDGDDDGDDLASGGVDVGNDLAARNKWILEQLAVGIELKAGSVVDHFNCSPRTAERALTALKNQGLIEYVGNTRTGYYRLVPPQLGQK